MWCEGECCSQEIAFIGSFSRFDGLSVLRVRKENSVSVSSNPEVG